MAAWGDPGGRGASTPATFFGNPLRCAAALATLDVLESERLAERARGRPSVRAASARRDASAPARRRGCAGAGLHGRRRAGAAPARSRVVRALARARLPDAARRAAPRVLQLCRRSPIDADAPRRVCRGAGRDRGGVRRDPRDARRARRRADRSARRRQRATTRPATRSSAELAAWQRAGRRPPTRGCCARSDARPRPPRCRPTSSASRASRIHDEERTSASSAPRARPRSSAASTRCATCRSTTARRTRRPAMRSSRTASACALVMLGAAPRARARRLVALVHARPLRRLVRRRRDRWVWRDGGARPRRARRRAASAARAGEPVALLGTSLRLRARRRRARRRALRPAAPAAASCRPAASRAAAARCRPTRCAPCSRARYGVARAPASSPSTA